MYNNPRWNRGAWPGPFDGPQAKQKLITICGQADGCSVKAEMIIRLRILGRIRATCEFRLSTACQCAIVQRSGSMVMKIENGVDQPCGLGPVPTLPYSHLSSPEKVKKAKTGPKIINLSGLFWQSLQSYSSAPLHYLQVASPPALRHQTPSDSSPTHSSTTAADAAR